MADPRVPALGVVACVGAFLAIADAVGAGRTQWLDDHVLSLLRRPGEPSRPVGPAWLEDAVRSVTVLGSSTLLILLGAAAGVALLVRRQFHALGLVLVAVAGGQVLNDLLKGAFQRARPAPFQLADVASPGFPSGHAMDSAVTYLTLAAVFSRLVQSRRVRLLLFAVAALSSALAGASRVYLGVHYPSDVVAGWVAGSAGCSCAGWRWRAISRAASQPRRSLPGGLAAGVPAGSTCRFYKTPVGNSRLLGTDRRQPARILHLSMGVRVVARLAAAGTMAFLGCWLVWAADVLPLALPARGFEPVKIERRLEVPRARADEHRRDSLARAQVWTEPEVAIAQADLRRTLPGSAGAPLPDEIACKFLPQETSGNMPKFDCTFENGEVLKVKYDNREVHTEVAAARLLQALGFGADEMYLVRTLRCFGCPKDPFPMLQCAFSRLEDAQRNCAQLEKRPGGKAVLPVDYGEFVDFRNVSVERRKEGKVIEGKSAEGWGFDALDDAQAGNLGATREQRDALRLMAVFLNDWDNRAANQRLLCLPAGYPSGDDGRCGQPFAYISDLGAAFGGRGARGERKLNVEKWAGVPIWKEPGTCRVKIRGPHGGLRALFYKSSFGEAEISERGRRFVADRLAQLSDRQVRDLFEGARITEYPDASDASKDIETWLRVFKQKVREIADRPACPSL